MNILSDEETKEIIDCVECVVKNSPIPPSGIKDWLFACGHAADFGYQPKDIKDIMKTLRGIRQEVCSLRAEKRWLLESMRGEDYKLSRKYREWLDE